MRPPRLACLVSLPRLPCSPCPFPCLPRLLACPAGCDSSLPCPRCPAHPSPPPSRPAPLALLAARSLMPPLSCPPDSLPVPVALRLLAAGAPLSSCGMSRGLAPCARVRPRPSGRRGPLSFRACWSAASDLHPRPMSEQARASPFRTLAAAPSHSRLWPFARGWAADSGGADRAGGGQCCFFIRSESGRSRGATAGPSAPGGRGVTHARGAAAATARQGREWRR